MVEPRRIPIALPNLGEEEWQAVREPLESGWVTQGPKVAAFETAFADRHAVDYALATTSCTTALHLILAAMEIGPGDEVIVPAFTWIASANAVVYVGATPVFADVDRTTFNLDPNDVADRVTPRTRAIIAVHLFGLCADLDAIRAAAPGVPIVEDAACASGAGYGGRPAGGLGLAAAFSFHPRKSITTGEGGMVTTNDADLAERMTVRRNHGASVPEEVRHHGPRPYVLPEFEVLGFNYRMTDIQAAIGLVQLRRLDTFLEERARLADVYRDGLAACEWLRLPTSPAGDRHGWQSYVCYVEEGRGGPTRNVLMEQLHEHGISTRPGTHAVPALKFYQEHFGSDDHDFPAARDCAQYSMALPLHNRMNEDDLAYVIGTIRRLVR